LSTTEGRQLELFQSKGSKLNTIPRLQRRPSSVDSSRVRSIDRDLIIDAASRTTGDITAHETSHEASQFHRKLPVAIAERLAMPAAIKEVNPDWMTPKMK
jgi:hypothetical protein